MKQKAQLLGTMESNTTDSTITNSTIEVPDTSDTHAEESTGKAKPWQEWYEPADPQSDPLAGSTSLDGQGQGSIPAKVRQVNLQATDK